MSQTSLHTLRRRPPPEATPRHVAVPLPPQRWKTRVLVPGAIVVAAGSLLTFAARDALRPAVAVQVVPAVVKTGVRSAGTAVVQAPGWVEPDPYAIAVSALTDGIVREVRVLEGQPVRQGDVLALLVDDDARLVLRRAEAELEEREAELETALALLKEAQGHWDHPIELCRKLATAQASLAEQQAELARWPSELQAEKARLINAESEFDRLSRIRAQNADALAERELIRARQERDAQQAIVQSVEGRRPVIEAQVQALAADVEAARQALELRIPETRAREEAKARVTRARAAVERARAVRDEARLRLDRMTIRSPIDGIVMSRFVTPGSKLVLSADHAAAAQVLRLYDPRKLQVRVDVPLGDAAHVAVGQAAEIVVNVLPDRVFAGTVTRIVHEADIQKNTLQVKVAIASPSPEIRPEMLARVRFMAAASQPASQQAAIFVPARLIRQQGGGAAVWLVDQNRNAAELRTVRPGGARLGEWVEVADGLRPGDWLIADAPADLDSGQAVRVAGEAPAGEAP